MVEVGAQRMFEKLIALDEDEHSMYGVAISVKRFLQRFVLLHSNILLAPP